MNTDELIESLARSPAPMSRAGALGRGAATIVAGMLLTLLLIAIGLGFRADLAQAMTGAMLWTKLAFTGSVAMIAVLGVAAMTRPEAPPPRSLALLALPVAVLAAICVGEALSMDRRAWMDQWLGFSWRICPALIVGLALPVGAAFTVALRPFAPTQLRLTGALAGLAAGALSATLYCLHCPESGAAFVMTWYSLGMLSMASAGALLGPRLLRW